MNAANKFLALCILCVQFLPVTGQTYDQTKSIMTTFLDSSVYHVDVRPLTDQSKAIIVKVSFQLISIVKVDDVSGSFICNGFLVLRWDDERVTWNPSTYGGMKRIYPHPITIWRPRVVLLNTLGERDLFGDNPSPTTIDRDGSVMWIPGGLFTTKCDLDMTKYPFDTQTCYIQMLPNGQRTDAFQFTPVVAESDDASPNGEWILHDMSINATNTTVGGLPFSTFIIKFDIERRPTFFVLNILFPVLLLSLLNILVFTIPAESGEKIGYSITVVLSLSVFLSIVTSMLPQSSNKVPNVTIYLFIQFLLSVLTLIAAIVIVFLHNQEEKVATTKKIKTKYSNTAKKINSMQKVLFHFRGKRQVSPPQSQDKTSENGRYPEKSKNQKEFTNNLDILKSKIRLDQEVKKIQVIGDDDVKSEDDEPEVNRYKIIGRFIDQVSLLVFTVVWLVVTFWYFTSVLT